MTARMCPLHVKTWPIDNFFKQHSGLAGVPDIRNDESADRINTALHREIRTALGERRIKHTVFAHKSVIDTKKALTDVEHLKCLQTEAGLGLSAVAGTGDRACQFAVPIRPSTENAARR